MLPELTELVWRGSRLHRCAEGLYFVGKLCSLRLSQFSRQETQEHKVVIPPDIQNSPNPIPDIWGVSDKPELAHWTRQYSDAEWEWLVQPVWPYKFPLSESSSVRVSQRGKRKRTHMYDTTQIIVGAKKGFHSITKVSRREKSQSSHTVVSWVKTYSPRP